MSLLYAGIDLHSNNSVLVVSDETDKVLYQKRLPNELTPILLALEPFGERVSGVVVESTYNWYWLVDGLMDNDYRLHLANTTAIQQYDGLKYADDKSDARWLAKMLRLNILPEGYIYPVAPRAIRDLLRRRSYFVKQRVSNCLSIKNILSRNLGYALSVAKIAQLTDDRIDELLPNPNIALSVKCTLKAYKCNDEQARFLAKEVLKKVKLQDDFQCLHSIPGVGDILAMTMMLEIGTINRFYEVGNFASYCRCVKSEHTSNKKRKGKGNTRCGNNYLAWAFIEAANFAIRFDPKIKKFYDRKKAKAKHPTIAIKTVAHKLARASYYMLKEQAMFDVEKAFGK